jgi:hypothetical protein
MNFPSVVQVNPKVLIVEDSFSAVIRRVIASILASSSRLNEEVFLNFSRSSADKDPSVQALPSVFIIRLVIGLIIINCDGIESFLLVLSLYNHF